jgi:protein-L-isoaspartate(D-aspartate) O-methyltransferase
MARNPSSERSDLESPTAAGYNEAKPPDGPEAQIDAEEFLRRREWMVDADIAGRGLRDPRVLHAMRTVAREAFVPASLRQYAYDDGPLPIGGGQTISQPYVVASMTEAAHPTPADRALEIGTGSGYAAAVLATIVSEVYTVERVAELASSADRRLARLGYRNVHVRHANGTVGWPEHGPYDAIIVTAGGPSVPPALLDQLAIGGRLIMPVGRTHLFQHLVRVTRRAVGDYVHEELEPVAFVPLIGVQGWRDEASAI